MIFYPKYKNTLFFPYFNIFIVKLRIFILGVEIEDEDILYQHNLTEDKPIYLVINNNI